MPAYFDDILNAVLDGIEKNPQDDVASVMKTKSKELGLEVDSSALETSDYLMESFDGKYRDLVTEKENNEVTTEAWMRRQIMDSTMRTGREEDRAKILEVVAETLSESDREMIENRD